MFKHTKPNPVERQAVQTAATNNKLHTWMLAIVGGISAVVLTEQIYSNRLTAENNVTIHEQLVPDLRALKTQVTGIQRTIDQNGLKSDIERQQDARQRNPSSGYAPIMATTSGDSTTANNSIPTP